MNLTIVYAYYKIDVMSKFLMLVLLSAVVNLAIKANLISLFLVLGINLMWLLFIMWRIRTPYVMYKEEDNLLTSETVEIEEIEKAVITENKKISIGILFFSFVLNCLIIIINSVIVYFF